MCRLVAAVLTLITALPAMAQTRDAGNEGDRATTSMVDLKASCGAAGDGVTDDSRALQSCIDRVNAAYAKNQPMWLHIPAGAYLIKNTNGALPRFAVGVPGAVIGDGPNRSSIRLDSGYAGDVFAWSGAISTVDFPGETVDPLRNRNGPTVSGLTIIGNRSAAHPQNALMFYDMDDAVSVQDVEVYSTPGSCLSIGHTRHSAVAFVRESFFMNIKCWNAGTDTVPAVELGSTTSERSDATNELNFYKLDVFHAAGTGVAISNHNRWNATRLIKFFGLRIEDSAHDGLDVGLASDAGQVHGIDIYDLDEPVIANGYYGVKITTGGDQAPYGINIRALGVGSGSGSGIDIDSARLVMIQATFATSGPNITLGPGAGTDIQLSGAGGVQPSQWTYAYDKLTAYGAALQNLRVPATTPGIPGSVDKGGTAVMRATATGTSPVRLTMDGTAPNAQNCFNPTYGQGFNLAIQLVAQDTTAPSNSYAWTMPVAYFSTWYGAGTARLSAGTPVTLRRGAVDGLSVAASADTAHGCLNLSFIPPTANTHTWAVTALITFVRAP